MTRKETHNNTGGEHDQTPKKRGLRGLFAGNKVVHVDQLPPPPSPPTAAELERQEKQQGTERVMAVRRRMYESPGLAGEFARTATAINERLHRRYDGKDQFAQPKYKSDYELLCQKDAEGVYGALEILTISSNSATTANLNARLGNSPIRDNNVIEEIKILRRSNEAGTDALELEITSGFGKEFEPGTPEAYAYSEQETARYHTDEARRERTMKWHDTITLSLDDRGETQLAAQTRQSAGLGNYGPSEDLHPGSGQIEQVLAILQQAQQAGKYPAPRGQYPS